MNTDVVIIGAGAIGLAIARHFSAKGNGVVLLEKESNYGLGISSRNSEVIHAGIYYSAGSLKASLCVRGKHLLYEYCARHNVRHRRIGKLFIAVRDEELSKLRATKEQALKNGVDDLIELDTHGVKNLEPEIGAIAALFSPSSGIFDSHGFMKSLFLAARSHDMVFAPNSPFDTAKYTRGSWEITAGPDDDVEISSRVVINAAGLYATGISEKMFPGRAVPTMYPTKGSYLRYSGNSPVRHIVYPAILPGIIEERVDATPDLGGGLRFGPDTEEVKTLEDFSLSDDIAYEMSSGIKRYLPRIDLSRLHPDCAGIRPKIYGPEDAVEDFKFDWAPQEGWLDLWGMESPGLTASLAVAEHVYELVKERDLL